MKVTILKDWGNFKKGDTAELKDTAVISKGLELKVFEEFKNKTTK